MAKSQIFASGDFTHSNSTDRYLPFGNTSHVLSISTENSVTTLIGGEGFTVSRLSCYVSANTRTTGTAEIRLRKGNSDANNVCYIPFGVSGHFSDSTSTDAYIVNDNIDILIKYGTGGTGAFTVKSISAVMDTTTSNTITRICAYANSNMGNGTTYSQPVDGTLTVNNTEANVQVKVSAGTIKNMYWYSASNSRDGDSTGMYRINGVDSGLGVTIPDSVTGPFQNDTSSATVREGDLLAIKTVRGGTGGAINFTHCSCNYVTANNTFISIMAGASTVSPSSATDYYLQIGGENTSTTDSEAFNKQRFYLNNFKAGKLRIHLTTNTVASTSTFKLRKNGADTALSISIGASTTGLFENTSNANAVSLASGDDINYVLNSGGSGSQVLKYASIRFIEVDPSAPPFLSGFSHRAPLNIDHTLVIEGIPYVPLYLSKCDATWWANVKTNGDDIRLTSDDGTGLLAHYLVPGGFDSTGKTGCILVKTTSYISNLFDKKIYAYCGNAGASSVSDSSSVFTGSGYVGVYMPGVTLTELCLSGRNLTAVGSPGTVASGYEGIKAATYNGSTQYHYSSMTPAVVSPPHSMEVLFNPSNITHNGIVFSIAKNTSTGNHTHILVYGSGGLGDRVAFTSMGDGGSEAGAETSLSFSATTWQYAAGSRSGTGTTGTSTAYLSGGNAGTNTTTTIATNAPNRTSIGVRMRSTPDLYFNGSVAAALLSSSVRSADFIKTKYNAYSNASFITASATEVGSSPTTNNSSRNFFKLVSRF